METDSAMHLNIFEILQLSMIALFVPIACFFIYLLNQNGQIWWKFDRKRFMMVLAMCAVAVSGLLAIFSVLARNGVSAPAVPLVPVQAAAGP